MDLSKEYQSFEKISCSEKIRWNVTNERHGAERKEFGTFFNMESAFCVDMIDNWKEVRINFIFYTV